MTITAGITEISYAGDNASTVFPVPFPFHDETDLLIVLTAPDGAAQTLTSGFTITGGAGETGDVTLDAPLASGYTLTVADNPELSQQVDYISNDAFPAETHEFALDKLTRIAKRLVRQVGRAARTQDGDAPIDPLPPMARRADQFFMFDSSGHPTVSELSVGSRAGRMFAFDQLGRPTTIPVAVPGPGLAPGAFINVKDFGAKGDGVVDDTEPVQNAADYAATTGGTLYLPQDAVFSVKNLYLRGGALSGNGILRWRSDAPASTPFIHLYGIASLRGAHIDGNRAENTSRSHSRLDALIYVHESGSSITGCKILSAPSTAICGELYDANDVEVSGNLFRNCRYYGVIGRGSRWVVYGNRFIGTGSGLGGPAVRFGRFASESSGTMYGNVCMGNTFYGVNSTPMNAELDAYGSVFVGNTALYCNGVIKIQYQPGEEVYNTVFHGNIADNCQYPVTWDDDTGTVTQDTSGGMITPVAIGGLYTTCTGNIFSNIAGILLANGGTFENNILVDVGNTNVAILRIASDSDGAVVSGNRIYAKSGVAISELVRIDADDVTLRDNLFVGNSDAANLVRVFATNDKLRDNKFYDSAGAIQVGSSIVGTEFTGNVFRGVTNPFSGVNTNSSETVFKDNVGATPPNIQPTLVVDSKTITPGKNRKVRVGTGTNGVSSDLDTIVGGEPGQVLLLTRVNSSQNVTLTENGNIVLSSGNYLLTAGYIGLICTGSEWHETFRE